MAVYKIPQDVEAEDKLLGPFTVKQTVFLFVASFFGVLGFFLFKVSAFFLFMIAPPFLLFAFLGVYRREDQPIEVYLASRIRFMFKPHRRVWDASGLDRSNLLVEKTKEIEGPRVGSLGSEEVESSLDRLSMLMDSRGWSTKGANQAAPGLIQPGAHLSGRLATGEVTVNSYATASDDVLDPMNNQASNTIMQLNRAAQVENRRRALQAMHAQPAQTQAAHQAPVSGNRYQANPVQQQFAGAPQNPVNQTQDPAIMNLLQNNDLTVESIARQANDRLNGHQ